MSLTLVVHQTAPRLGEVAENLREMRALVDGSPKDSLSVFPELSLTGYDLGASARDVAVHEGAPPPLDPGGGGRTAVFGFPELARDSRLYNSAGVVRNSDWLARHRKRYLPTYGMFDEARIFAAGGSAPRVFNPHPDWPTCLLVCEELWHPALAYLGALRGARLILVLAAAPGRGRPQDPDEDGPRFRSHRAWRLLARTTALTHGVYVALANRVGTEGGVVFAGGSMVVDPTGTVVAEASHRDRDRLQVTLDPDAVRAARHPYSHLRDEDLELVRRELAAILSREPGTGDR